MRLASTRRATCNGNFDLLIETHVRSLSCQRFAAHFAVRIATVSAVGMRRDGTSVGQSDSSFIWLRTQFSGSLFLLCSSMLKTAESTMYLT